MAAEEPIPESLSRGKDGKYQIRIESYDPARNTMKAIWLVSRSEKTLSNLLEKCDVSETGTTDEDLRGNLLSVQRELEELREAMDRTDGTQTPTIDASFFTRSHQMNNLDSFSGSFGSSERVLDRTEGEGESLMMQRPASAAPALDFGLAKRKRVFLSQIPLYSRPSIRTDFCVCPIDPFPEIRMRASKIPRAPKKNKTHPKKASKASKKQPSGPMSRPKTSLGNARPMTKAVSSKKTSMARPATSMALSRSLGVERTYLDNSIDERRPLRGCKTIVLDAKDQRPQKRSPTRAASSLGGRGIPRSSSRLSTFGTRAPSLNLSGRHSAMSGSTSSTSSSYMQMYLASKSTPKGQNCTNEDRTTRSNGVKKGQLSTAQIARESKGKRTQRPKSSLESTRALNSSSQVLSFESPPPSFNLDSQSVQGTKSQPKIVESSPERSASPLITAVSIIDDLSEGGESRESNTSAPRMLLGEAKDPEHQVKAFFLEGASIKGASLDTQGSAIIPSSPVEVAEDSTHDQDDKTRDAYIHYREIVGDEQKESNEIEQNKVAKDDKPETSDSISSKKDANLCSGPTEKDLLGDKKDQTDFGFLEEFQDEVSGLLDSLMSQDLQSAFTPPDLQSPPEYILPSLTVSERPQAIEEVDASEEQTTITTIDEVQSTPIEDSVITQSEAPVQNEEKQEVPVEESRDLAVEEAEEGGLSVQSEDVKAQDSSETAPIERSESAIDSDHPSIVQEDSTGEKEASKSVTDEHSKQDPIIETSTKTSKSVTDEQSKQDPIIEMSTKTSKSATDEHSKQDSIIEMSTKTSKSATDEHSKQDSIIEMSTKTSKSVTDEQSKQDPIIETSTKTSKSVTDEQSKQDPIIETSTKTSTKAKADRKQRKSTGIRTLPSQRCTRGKTQNSTLRRARSQSGLESVSEHSVRQESAKAGPKSSVGRSVAFFTRTPHSV